MKAGSCRYFTGIQNARCNKGIAYKSVRDESKRPYGFPCLATGGTCEGFSAYTAEEEAADELAFRDRLSQTMTARQAIIEHAGSGPRPVGADIPCPVCEKGTLRYSIASNHHVHAACNTPDCVRWME